MALLAYEGCAERGRASTVVVSRWKGLCNADIALRQSVGAWVALRDLQWAPSFSHVNETFDAARGSPGVVAFGTRSVVKSDGLDCAVDS